MMKPGALSNLRSKVQEHKRTLPFDELVRRAVDKRIAAAPAGKGGFKAVEITETIFSKLAKIRPGEYGEL